MPFPDAPKIIYNKNPLKKVICQFKFPSILKIDTEPPAQFQELIREEFPEFHLKEEPTFLTPVGMPQEVQAEMFRQIMPSESKNYEFSSEDGVWKANLTKTFFAFSTKKYLRGSDFKKHLELPLKAFIDIYKPAYFTRVGLRYVDVIKRSELNLIGIKWKELLKPHILGFLNEDDIENDIQAAECQYEISLPEHNSRVRIVAGLTNLGKDNEKCFKIDSDFFTNEKTKVADVIGKMDFFHITASRLLQWIIQPKLDEAMEPDK